MPAHDPKAQAERLCRLLRDHLDKHGLTLFSAHDVGRLFDDTWRSTACAATERLLSKGK